MRLIWAHMFIVLLLAGPAVSATYYVSPTGNDDDDGLSTGTAWESIDNGDQKGLLVPGDTVNILPGTYHIGGTVQLKTDGTPSGIITYRRLGEGDVVLDRDGGSGVALKMEGMYAVLSGIEVTGTTDEGIHLKAGFCAVTECHVHNTGKECFRIEASDCLLLRNIAAYSGEEGLKNEGGAHRTRYYGNTVYQNAKHGIELKADDCQVINNIVVGNDDGINGHADNIIICNDVWDNDTDYAGGAADDSGGISADPLLVDPASGNFYLGYGSPAIDAGTYRYYAYAGDEPDMGAIESCPLAARDEFNAQSYDNNDGSLLWTGPWTEFGEGDGPDDGLVRARNYEGCCPAPYCLRLGGDYDYMPIDFGVAREVDLSGATSAYLSYNYRRHPYEGYNADSPALVQISGDGGFTWNTLQTVWNGTDDECIPVVHDISDYVAGDTQIKFTTNSAWHIHGWVYFDNIQIQYDTGCDMTPEIAALEIVPLYVPMCADSSYQFDVVAIDGEGHPVDPGPLEWSHTFSSGSIDAGGLFTPQHVGSGVIAVTATDHGLSDVSDTMTVVEGALDSLFVSPMRDTVSVDSTRQFTATGRDAEDNPVDSLGVLTWEVLGGIGSIDSTGLFDAAAPGSGFIQVTSSLGPSAVTDTISVVPGEPAYMVIAPDEAIVSSDSTLQFVCISYDAEGYPTTPQLIPEWRVFGGIGSIDAEGLFTPKKTSDGKIIATSGDLADTTGTITVVAGDIAFIDVTPDARTVVEGANVTFVCKAYDADSNFVSVITTLVDWTTTDPSGSITGQGVYRAGTDLSPPDYYVIATYSGFADTSVVTVTSDGTVRYIRVEWDDGTPVQDTTFTADDDGLVIYCRSYDSADSLIGDEAVDWELLEDTICDLSEESGKYTSLTMHTPGTGRLRATQSPSVKDTSGYITCLPGEPAELVVSPPSAVLASDSTLDFDCESIDDDGNATAPQVEHEWSVLDGIGSITTAGLFTPAAAGTGYVVATGGALADTAEVVVVPGALDSLAVTPYKETISADSTRQFAVRGFDSRGLPVTALGTLTWSVLGGIGTIDDGGLFTAVTAGYGYIKVQSSLGVSALTDTITVLPGEVVFIDVVPAAQIVVEDSSFQFSALGFDADSNLAGDYSAQSDWSTSDPSGSVTGSGLYMAGTDISPPVYHVTASLHLPVGALNSVTDSSAVTVITDGSLSYIRIEWPGGAPVNDTTLTTDDDGTTMFCRAYDSGDNLVADAAATWSVITDDSVATVATGPAASTALTLLRTGTGRVRAAFGPGIADTTGIITCVAGAPARLVISPDTATVTAGASIAFETSTFDADNNISSPVPIDSWEVMGAIGNISSEGVFGAITEGTGAVACTGGGLSDSTGAIVVLADMLAELDVIPDSVEVALSASQQFTATGLDAYGNSVGTGDVVWDVIGDIGTIDNAGLFTAQSPGTGRVSATSDLGGVGDTNRVVSVLSSDLAYLLVTPDTASVRVSGTVQFVVSGFDAGYEPVSAGPVDWDVLGGIGSINSTGEFAATSPGVGYITAASSMTGASDTTNMIVVEVPTAEEIPLGDRIVHAGDIMSSLLTFRLANSFNGAESVESITVRDASRGEGTAAQVRNNVDSLDVFVDSNGNAALDGSDTWLAASAFNSAATTISFTPHIIGPGSSSIFFVAARIAGYPRDGDSLDLYLLPDVDIEIGDGSTVAGPDTLNSLGYNIIDGLVSGQIVLAPPEITSVAPGESGFNTVTIDVPRNGYSHDVLKILSVYNSGTADTLDLDSLVLYRDAGDGAWGGTGAETRIGELSFTGDQWEISGISQTLTGQVTRFYLAAAVAADASDGATLSFGIPLHGFEMNSANDGPIDSAVQPVGTITVLDIEAVSVRATEIDSRELVPGLSTGPVAAFEFVNGYAQIIEIDEILITSYAGDPEGADQSDIDSQFGSVSLWLDLDGDPAVHGAADSLIASGTLSSGTVAFDTDGLSLSAHGFMAIFVEADLLAETARNANTVNFGIDEAAAVDLSQSVLVSGAFPVKNPENFNINIFQASQVTVNQVEGITLYGGDTEGLVLDFSPPRNGYSDDALQSLRIVNRGSAADGDLLENVKLWADLGAPGFTGADTLLGYFTYTDTAWTVYGLSHPLDGDTTRFFITVDVLSRDFVGGTLRFEIPVGGAVYLSGADGPDDEPVGNAETHFILPSNRITAISIPRDAARVYPGTANAQVLTFALYNGYTDEAHSLSGIRLSNRTVTASDDNFADFELGQVSLYYDSNSNREFDGDSLLAAGYFNSGGLSMDGLSVTLPPESLSYFFVTSKVPLGVIDGDTLEISIEEHSDFAFARTVNLNGDLPLNRGGPLVIDGSVCAQYGLITVSGRTLSPGDESVPLFAFRPAENGDQADTLTSVTIMNDGDAGSADIGNLRLWVDANDDQEWQATDIFAGGLTYSGGFWTADGLEIEVVEEAPALFLTGDVKIGATPNSSFRAVVPFEGCQFNSGNDGPLDADLVSEQMFVISSSGLSITYELEQSKYSVGQDLNLKVHVTNILPTTLDDIVCDATFAGTPGTVELDSTYTGPASLTSGETAEFDYYYTAAAQGDAYWLLRAFSTSVPESSATVETEEVEIQTVPTGVVVEMISSIPTAVTRGQSHVFPLSVRYHHADVSPLCAPVRLDSLRIHVEDGLGGDQPASDVFERMVLGAGYTNLAIVESFDSESSVLLEFVEPAIISPGEEQILSLRVDIDSTAAASAFALSLRSETSVRFHDSNTGGHVPVDPSVTFPLETASCAINDPSQSLAVSYVPVLSEHANYGQCDIPVMQIILRHYGAVGNSQIKFTGLSFELTDAGGTALSAGDLVESVKVLNQQTPLGELASFTYGDSLLTLWLTSPLVVSPGHEDTVRIEVSLKPQSQYTGFALTIEDSSLFVLRDLSSGSIVPAVGDTATGAIQPAFPMNSGYTGLRQPARGPEICLVSNLGESIVAGDDSVSLLGLDLCYYESGDYSPVVLEYLVISLLDTLGRSLDPSQLFDRIGFAVSAGPAQYASSIEHEGGYTLFNFGDEGIEVSPGGEIEVDLIGDIEADTPYDHFIIKIIEAEMIGIADATDPAHRPGFEEAPECEGLLPFETGIASIYLPAGTPELEVIPVAARIGVPGGRDVKIFMGELTYETDSPRGDLVLVSLAGDVLSRSASGDAYISAADVFDAVHLVSGDDIVATDSVLSGSRISLLPGSEYVISRGVEHTLSIVCDLSASIASGNYVLEFGDVGFMRLADRNLATTVYPELVGADLPVRSAEISVAGEDLAASFTNYPNPFNPARGEHTTIGFYISESARVDIEIFTVTGDLVKKVAWNVEKSEGTHQDDTWSGLNEEGLGVLPGTYLCRITARYSSGNMETCKRKVMVIR